MAYEESQNNQPYVDVDRALSALKMVESMGKYDERGGSGEYGAYQFMPDTWKQWSREYAKKEYGIDVDELPMVRENQDAVARYKVDELAKKGWGIEQIASYWNSGSPDPSGKIGYNAKGQYYNTPHYVKLAKGYYENSKQSSENRKPRVEIVEGPGMVDLLAKESGANRGDSGKQISTATNDFKPPKIEIVSGPPSQGESGVAYAAESNPVQIAQQVQDAEPAPQTPKIELIGRADGQPMQPIGASNAVSGVKNLASGAFDLASKTAGATLGTLNAPVAFLYGGLAERYNNPEEYAKMPLWEQMLTSLGGAFDSAWRSISKPGDWGTMYGEYVQKATGKTIEEHLPNGVKWLAPTLEFIGNAVSDPLLVGGIAKDIANLKDIRSLIPKMPENSRILTDLDSIAKLEGEEKRAAQEAFINILKNRQAQKVDEIAKQEEAVRLWMREKGWETQNPFEGKTPEPTPQPPPPPEYQTPWIRSANRQSEPSGSTPSPFAGSTPPPTSTATSQVQPRVSIEVPQPVVESQPTVGVPTESYTRNPFSGAKPEPTPTPESPPVYNPPPPPQPTQPQQYFEPYSSAFRGVTPEPTPQPIEAPKVYYPPKTEPPTPEQPKSKQLFEPYSNPFMGGSTKEVHGAAGAAAGFEIDEEGNFNFNPDKALMGAGIGLGVSHLNPAGAKKFREMVAKYPEWSKVSSQIGEKKSVNWFGILPKLGAEGLDRFWPMKRISKDAYEEARIFTSYKDAAEIYLKELGDNLKDVRNDEGIFTHYVLAHRDMDRASRNIANPKGVTLDDARIALDQMRSEFAAKGKDPALLDNALTKFHEFGHDRILKPMLDEGLISQASYDTIKANNPHYAAFDVLDQMPDMGKGELNFIPGKEWFSVSEQGIIKPMVGTERQIGNPIEATLKKFMDAQALIARNRVAKTFIDDVTTNPNPDIRGLLQPVARTQKDAAVMRANGLNPVLEGRWAKGKYDTIAAFEDGKAQVFIAPREVAESMKQLTPGQANRAVQMLNSVFKASATTLYLPFTVSNAMRDALMAYATSPVYKWYDVPKFARDWGEGAYHAAKQIFGVGDDVVKEYLKSGGGFGYTGELRRTGKMSARFFEKKPLGKAVSVVTSPFKLIEKISDVVELSPRVGVYQRAQKMGASARDAALEAREATIDFSRGGSLLKVVNQYIPFLNARVQARLQVAEALRNDTKNTLAKIFTATTIPAIASYAYNKLNYPELDADIPDQDKRNYFNIITGSTTDDKGRTVPTRIVIPKGDVGQIGSNFAEYLLDRAWNRDKRGTLEFLTNFLNDVISPVDVVHKGEFSGSKALGSAMPPIVKGFAENLVNRNLYFNRDIENMGDLKKPSELRYDDKSPPLYKEMAKLGVFKWADWGPKKIQNFMSNVIAGYGREGLDATAMLKGLTGRFYRESGGEKASLAGDVIKEIEAGYNSVRAYAGKMAAEGDRSGARELIRAWNQGLRSQISKIEEHGFKDKGGLRRDYTFTPEKIHNIFKPQQAKKPWLEQKLEK